MKRLLAFKKILLALFVFILCAISVPVFGQSAMPPDANNFLQVVGDTATGAIDRVNVVFFEIPDSEPGPFNFAIYDPGISGNYDQVIGGATTSTYHYLVGGTGTLQNADSRKWFYYDTANEIDPDGDPDTYNGQPLTGNVLDQLTYAPTEDVDSGWVYFTSVYAFQGERIGNKLYFKVVTIVTAATDDKNGYRLDLSSDRNPVPSPIAGVRSFAYSLAIRHVPGGGTTWNLYPFVPDNRVNDYIIFSNNDMDNDGATGTAYDVSDTAQGTALGMSGNNDAENTSYQILLGEDNGFWTYSFGDFAASSNPNTAEIWTWIDSNPHNDSAAFDWALGIPDMPAANGSVRIYSAKFPITLPDYVTIDADDGVAISDGTDTERLVLQLVDAAGNPVLYERNIYVSLSGSGLIEAASNYISAPVLPQNSGTIQTDEFGMATIDISDNVVGTEIVTVTLTTDGTTGVPASSGPFSLTANESATVTFQDDIDPSLSSATNTTFDAGNAQVLPDITIADSGIANINDTDNIRIQIPAGLDAVFDTGSTVTFTITGTGTGRVDGAVSGTATMAWEDTNHRAVINVTTAFAVGDILTISGLAFTNGNTGSTGSLTLSVNGAGGPYTITDDKVITIIGAALTSFTWSGTVDSDWTNPLNWNPNTGVPDTATESAVIPNVANDPSIPNGTNFTLDDLTIGLNGELTMNGNTITVSGDFTNSGILRLRGDETLTLTNGNDLLPANNGTIEYWGSGGTVFAFTGDDYYNIVINAPLAADTFVLAENTVVVGNLTITQGTLDVTAALFALSVAGNWVNTGTFVPQTGTVTFNGPGSTGTGPFYRMELDPGTFGTRNASAAWSVTNTLILTDGTINPGAFTHQIAGNWNDTSVDFSPASGTINLTGTSPTITTVSGNYFFNLSLTDGAILASDIDINGSLNIVSGTLDTEAVTGYDIYIAGDWIVAATAFFEGWDDTVFFDGGGTSNINAGGNDANHNFYNVTVQGTTQLNIITTGVSMTGTLTIPEAATVVDFNDQSFGINVVDFTGNNGRIDLDGTQAVQGIITMLNAPGIIRYTGNDGNGTIRIDSFFDLEINDGVNTAAFGIDQVIDVLGDLTITGGTLDAVTFDISVAGVWTNNGTFAPGTQTVTFNNAGGIVVLNSGGTAAGKRFFNVQFTDGTAGVPLPIYQLDTNSLYCGGNITIGDGAELDANNFDITVGGNWNNTGTGIFDPGPGPTPGTVLFIAAAGNVTIDSGGIAAGKGFFSVQFNNAAQTFFLSDDIDVNGNLNITAGILDVDAANDYDIYIAGNWTGTGTFTPQNGTVYFDGTSTMQTSEDFYSVTIQENSSLDITGFAITAAGTYNIADGATRPQDGILYRTGGAGESAPIDTNSGRVVYRGAAGGTIQVYGSDPDYNDLEVAGAGTFTFGGDLQIARDFYISVGTLNAGGMQIEILRHFIQIGGIFNAQTSMLIITEYFDRSAGAGTFSANTGEVVFVDNARQSRVLGSTTFYDFTCMTNNKVIYFDDGQTTTIASGGTFEITGTAANQVQLLSTFTLSAAHPSGPYTPIPPPLASQWIITITPGGFANVTAAYVELSYATNPIYPDDDTSFRLPAVDDYCFNWRITVPVDNSGVEDSDGDGVIDRIRVQVDPGAIIADGAPGAFAGMNVLVEAPWTITGYDPGLGVSTDDTFYILIEKPGYALDTYSTPRWSITNNTTLRTTTGSKFVYTNPAGTDYSQTPADEADPIVGYSLAAGGGYQVFIHFSEPVYDTVFPAAIGTGNFTYGTGPTTAQQISANEYLLTFPAVITIEDIIDGALITYNNIFDQAGLQLLGAGPYTRQISDLILALPGNEPITFILADYTPREPVQVGPGIGYISVFDGSGWIQIPNPLQDVDLAGTLLGAANGNNAEIIWKVNTTADFSNIQLWYPDTAGLVQPYGLVSGYSTPTGSITPAGATYSITYLTFPAPFTEIAIDERMCEFFVRYSDAPTNLLYARLARPTASDWYRSVRPFAFGVHSPGGQHGTVTIHNNVINPNNGEIAKLHVNVPRAGNVTIQVFSLAGDIVDVLSSGNRAAGEFSIYWDGRNTGGRVVARGLYFVKIVGPDIDEMRKIMVVK